MIAQHTWNGVSILWIGIYVINLLTPLALPSSRRYTGVISNGLSKSYGRKLKTGRFFFFSYKLLFAFVFTDWKELLVSWLFLSCDG